MKKILFGVLLCLLMATPVWADTDTQTLDCYGKPPDVCVWTLTWVDTTGDGVSVRMGIDSRTGQEIFQSIKGYYAFPIITDPGSPAPTALYDATLLDDFGVDLAGGLLANRATATSERIVPKVDTANSIYGGAPLLTPVTLAITDASQDQAGATGKVIVVFWRN